MPAFSSISKKMPVDVLHAAFFPTSQHTHIAAGPFCMYTPWLRQTSNPDISRSVLCVLFSSLLRLSASLGDLRITLFHLSSRRVLHWAIVPGIFLHTGLELPRIAISSQQQAVSPPRGRRRAVIECWRRCAGVTSYRVLAVSVSAWAVTKNCSCGLFSLFFSSCFFFWSFFLICYVFTLIAAPGWWY